MTPSSPAPSKRRNQSVASARSRVAGERCTGGAAPASTCSSRSRRTARGALRRSSSPSASRSQATNEAGACAESSFTRDAAGWMRKSRASKSSPPPPTLTISPSTTQRSDSMAASGAMSSGKYRFMVFSSRLCSRISSPSRNTSVRKPSHLGSNCHPSPAGKASAARDNIGARGGAKGRRIDLFRMTPELTRQLGNRPIPLDRRQRHLGFVRPVVLLACPLHVLLPRHRRFLGAGLHLSQLSHFRGPAHFSGCLNSEYSFNL